MAEMEILSLRSSSVVLLLFSLLLVVADCNTTIKQTTGNGTGWERIEPTSLPSTTPPPPTTPKPTPPPNVVIVSVVTQNESSITLQWNKVDSFSTYRLGRDGGEPIDVPVSPGDTVEHVVSGLNPGIKYNFILFSVANALPSSGYHFTAVTVPGDADSFKPFTQTETSITLQWNQVGNIDNYTLSINGTEVNITYSAGGGTHTVSSLNNTTRYSFTLFTVFYYTRSRGATITAVTAPPDADRFDRINQTETSITLEWSKVGNIDNYNLSINGTEVPITHSAGNGKHTVSDLISATRYNFTLFTVFENVKSDGATITAVTAPGDTGSFKPISQNETSITLQWSKVGNINTYILSYDGKEFDITNSAGNGKHTVSDLTSATRYIFTLITVFDYTRSDGATITAVTAPRKTENFDHINQNETSITLEWNKVGNIDTYILSYNGDEVNITHSAGNGTYTVSGLTSATRYSITLFTVFDYARGDGATITAVTAPEAPAEFGPPQQTETSITLQWKPVKNIIDYIVAYKDTEINITTSDETVTQTISGLDSGTGYDFWIFSVFDYARSRGATITAPTVPPQVSSVNVERSVNGAVLKWEDPNKGWEYELKVDQLQENITKINLVTYSGENLVTYSVENLKAGTKYSFSIITLFSGLRSSNYTGIIVTKIDCSAVTWSVTNSSIQGTVEGLFSTATASYGSQTHISPEGKDVTFSGLHPGATYNISLLYETSSELYPQCSISKTIIPPSIFPHCSFWGSGYSALIKWETPNGVWTAGELNMNEKNLILKPNENQLIVDGLQPAKTYKVSVNSKLETEADPLRSERFIFSCSTDNRGVIGGSVVGVLLIALLICVIVFIVRKKPDIIRKKSFLSGSKKSDSKGKVIPVAKFPDHYHQLSLDDNRGFSQEYESLGPAGTNQTQKAATLLENKGKNRFTNILPYDWSRVKLNTSTPNNTLDYINANYLPGYSSSKEYIACQGPLPNTVSDFWRMVWEQKVKRIVMVTNCVEAGRTKCEQYWPEDRSPCAHGELIVSKTSEERESNWVLREFKVKHTKDSEERTVKHFHFTAWPDHGVPQGTDVLIRFRGLVRKHIESEGSKAPTVVHCSAGVGRTGTIIALDVLLQQLQQERAVGINGFVYKMRQHRSHMVQTESQYVFLHQCIMDSLQPPGGQEENIYENGDLIYVNATALRQLR